MSEPTSGIFVTNIVPPKQGWPMAAYCSICKETNIFLEPLAVEPKNGGFLTIKGMCVSPTEGLNHSIRMIMEEAFERRLKERLSSIIY